MFRRLEQARIRLTKRQPHGNNGSEVARMLWWLAGMAAAGYGFYAALSFFYQRALIYPAPAHPIEPRLGGAKLEDIPGPEGTHVYALHAPARPGSPTIVHFHGNGEDLA